MDQAPDPTTPRPELLHSTLALDWHELKLQLEELHAKLEYAKLMLKLSLKS